MRYLEEVDWVPRMIILIVCQENGAGGTGLGADQDGETVGPGGPDPDQENRKEAENCYQ